MRPLRILVLFALIVFGAVVPALPAQAGGWAVTLLDPLPERFEAGHSYTIGYWVLQHGSHPCECELGRTGLRMVGPNGHELTFDAVALREPAHYAVAMAVPTDGTWQVYAMQGWFAEHNVGTLTVPGGLALRPPDAKVDVGGHSHEGNDSPWGAIHPPGAVTDGHSHDHAAAKPQDVQNLAAAAPQPSAEQESSVVPALLVFGSVVVLLGLALGVRPLRRRLRG